MDQIVLWVHTVNSYLATSFQNGVRPIDAVVETVQKAVTLEGVGSSPIVIGAGLSPVELSRLHELLPDDWDVLNAPNSTAASVYQTVVEKIGSSQDTVEQLICFRLDAPFVAVDWIERLVDLQRRSWCDYTFADGYPRGYTPEIVRSDVLPVLISLADSANQRWAPGAVFETLSNDINAFDIETEAAPEDFAILRVNFTCDTRQNYIACRRIAEKATDGDYLSVLMRHPEIRRTLPYYYQVQITSELVQRPEYTPWRFDRWSGDLPKEGRHMSVANWEKLLSTITTETPEATIAIGYRGEPALHPDLDRLITAAEEYPGIQIYIETSGLQWSSKALSALETPAVAAVIVELDTTNPETYRELRGDDRYDEAVAFVESIRQTIPGKVYVQATRIKRNEWELQDFYTYWSEKPGVSVIIQKHNSFAAKIEDQRVADLTPLHRMACRHLERDMVILLDGSVPRCVQDIDGETNRGNVLLEGVTAVWERGQADFLDHLTEVYTGICENCDEYYTYNA